MGRELLFSVTPKDLRIEFYRGSGAGGQKRNKTDSACRITHEASGAVGTAEDERKQSVNKRLAFRRMVNSAKFQLWLKRRTAEAMTGETIGECVERMMAPENIRAEVSRDGKWEVSDG